MKPVDKVDKSLFSVKLFNPKTKFEKKYFATQGHLYKE